MIVSSDYIRNKLKDAWPDLDLRNVWLLNKEYTLPTKNEIKKALAVCKVDLPKIPQFSECELFALDLHTQIKKYQVQNKYGNLPWAFGHFTAETQSPFGQIVHTACVCVLKNSCMAIEPMNNNKIEDCGFYKTFFVHL